MMMRSQEKMEGASLTCETAAKPEAGCTVTAQSISNRHGSLINGCLEGLLLIQAFGLKGSWPFEVKTM